MAKKPNFPIFKSNSIRTKNVNFIDEDFFSFSIFCTFPIVTLFITILLKLPEKTSPPPTALWRHFWTNPYMFPRKSFFDCNVFLRQILWLEMSNMTCHSITVALPSKFATIKKQFGFCSHLNSDALLYYPDKTKQFVFYHTMRYAKLCTSVLVCLIILKI